MSATRRDIERATEIGIEKKGEGYSPEALVLAVDEVLNDIALSRAIVVYVQSVSLDDPDAALERPFSWFSVLISFVLAVFCLWLVYLLFTFVSPTTGLLQVILLVIGQAILLRLARNSLRLAFLSACDGLNDASYPTNLHPLRRTSSAVGALRIRRLRALIREIADQIASGTEPSKVEKELSEVNLTPRAARLVVRLAQINAAVRDYLPPYQSRWLGLTLAVVFLVTCIVMVERAGDRLSEGLRNYAIGVTGWIAGDIAAKPRRRPRSPAS